MTDAEQLRGKMAAIFNRNGRDGRYTRLFENLEASQQAVLLKEVALHDEELPAIGSVESEDAWLIITTERVVWHLKGNTQTLSIDDLWHVKADFHKMVADNVRKHQLRELQIETLAHEHYTIEVEEGAPLTGVWNALLHVSRRNRRRTKEQAKG
jgi:hypothetical protein